MTAGAGPVVSAETQLFVYWHLPPADLDLALRRLAAAQAALQRDVPGLAAALYVRPPPDAPAIDHEMRETRDSGPAQPATVMETYRRPGGLDAAAEARIHDQVEKALAGLPAGPRHTERFRPVVGPA